MTIGIDKLSFFVPPYYVDMTLLAKARGEAPEKYHIGLGQDKMSVNSSSQDIVTFATNAASAILTDEDRQTIDTVIVATESGIDESKASAVIVHDLLNVQPFARSLEIKEACYGATAGLLLAKSYVKEHPDRKVLVIATDIARYGLKTSGEPTQGAGAVALLVTANPRILALNDDNIAFTQDIYDFWRPTGQDYPSVDGKLSNQLYMESFARVWKAYSSRTEKTFQDFAALIFHTPYTKMGKKALLPLIAGSSEEVRLLTHYENAIVYNRQIGNLYTGSLYLSLISLLENSEVLRAGETIGLFSYGSGTVSEFFTGTLVEGYRKQLRKVEHEALLAKRKALSIADYERFYTATHIDESSLPFSLKAITDEGRKYRAY